MVAKGRGGGKTPVKVVELLAKEVAGSGQAATARATGLTLQTVQRYIKGIGEPSQATLEKLADYFKMPVWELRGDTIFNSDVVEKSVVEIFTSLRSLREKIPLSDDMRLFLSQIENASVRILKAVTSTLVDEGSISPGELKIIDNKAHTIMEVNKMLKTKISKDKGDSNHTLK